MWSFTILKININGKIRGRLYLNAYDVDYLVSKYGSYLKSSISSDYIETFEKELNKRKKESALSVQWYPVLSLGIETDEDEELIKIISQEISEGNMLTRKQLQELSIEELEERIASYPSVESVAKSILPPEELYKLRSYQMAKFIIDSIELGNKLVSRLYSNPSPQSKACDEAEYLKCVQSLEAVGASTKIEDSDYFSPPTQLQKNE